MKLDYESTEPDVRIEIVPLIDVIFCILTFFILAAVTLTRQAAINVDLPRANSGATQMRQTLIVSVDPIGTKYLEKLPVSNDQLYQAIVTFREQNPEGMVVLYAARSASYNDVVEVLDLLRSAGGDRVALATLPGENNGAIPPGAGTAPNQPGSNSEPLFPQSVPSPNGGLSDPFNLDPNANPNANPDLNPRTPSLPGASPSEGLPNSGLNRSSGSGFELPTGSGSLRSPSSAGGSNQAND